jgi:hypothetical protein
MLSHVFDQVEWFEWFVKMQWFAGGWAAVPLRCGAVFHAVITHLCCRCSIGAAFTPLSCCPAYKACILLLAAAPSMCGPLLAPSHRTLPQRLAAVGQWRIIPLGLIAGLVGPLTCPVVVLLVPTIFLLSFCRSESL